MNLFSQEKFRQHTVSKGETISEIAQKYNVKASAIYELNPDAVNGIKYKTVLLIPTNTKKNKTVSTSTIASNLAEKTHEVLPKETVYGIAKQCNISVEELYKINPDLEKEGLKIGQKINIPQTAPDDFVETTTIEKSEETLKKTAPKTVLPEINNSKTKVVASTKSVEKVQILTEGISYEVLPKESLYSIAKKYGITLANLQKANPELEKKSLKAGQKITVPINTDANNTLVAEISSNLDNSQKKETKQAPVLQQPVVENKKSEVEKTIPVVSQTKDDSKKIPTDITHDVLHKESFYSIAKQYGISLSELKKANSELGNKSLKVGQKIKVPVKSDTNSGLVSEKVTEKNELAITPQVTIEVKTLETEVTHEVLTKETKYGIAKKYGLTIAELESQNPNISKKLLVGSVLKIRTSKLIEKETAIENPIISEVPSNEDKFENKEPNIVRDANFADQLISKASEHIGTRYRSGGTTTDGFDCSGLMCYTFSSYDIKLPRSSAEMASYGSKIEAQYAQKGDLIFFKTRGSGRINHVGMVVEVLEGEIKFIHSATHGGVIISSTKESYYERNLAQINRVL